MLVLVESGLNSCLKRGFARSKSGGSPSPATGAAKGLWTLDRHQPIPKRRALEAHANRKRR